MKTLFSIKQIFVLYLVILEINLDDDICTLTGKPRADPYPSLLKCYKYNNEACCLSVHDDIIDTYINDILSPSCIRKYPFFEILMCFGCHPNEHNYINKTTNEIRICKSFAEEMWGGDLDKPSSVFDQCGFKVAIDTLKDKYNKSYIIPSNEFDNFTHFLKYIPIPLYDDYNILIQEETNDLCYNKDSYIRIHIFVFMYFFFFSLFSLI